VSTTFDTMDQALLGILARLLGSGSAISPRGLATRELLSDSFRLANPRARRIALPSRGWKESLAVGELCWHLSKSDSVDVISYYAPVWAQFSEDGERISSSCYGKRIFGGAVPSQWDRARDALANDPASRRAVLTLVDTETDPTAAKDVSCITSIQFLLRGGRLHCITSMRSCDAIWGLCYDVYLCTMLQELMAAQLGVSLGWYDHVMGSLHIYEQFVPMAEQILTDGLTAVAEPMPPMEALNALPMFLAAESALRRNQAGAGALIEQLPAYWRTLAEPLRKLQRRRLTESSV
jgi:thymidylate synthase